MISFYNRTLDFTINNHHQIQCKKCIDFHGNKKRIKIDDKINTLISTIKKHIDFNDKNQKCISQWFILGVEEEEEKRVRIKL